ncbi:Regulating synaptic membrane exocytosis protein 1, partial [Myotis davidii]
RLHQQFESYKEQVRKIGEEARRYQGEHRDDAPTCGICHKTKFADGCGHLCSYCRTKFCARCGGRVSLRSNNVMWVCNLCRKQQEILTKSGAWFFGSGPQQPSQDGTLSDTATGAGSEVPREKKARLQERSRSQTPLSTAAASSQDTAPPSAQPDRSKGAEPSQQAMGPEQKQAASRSRSEPPRERKKTPGLSEQNGKGAPKSERKRVPKTSVPPGEGALEDRERKERRESRRLEKGRSQDFSDLPGKREEGKAAVDEKQRSEEYQTRYRSDPNLARYPVKAPLEEQQMRMHARVSRARHERRFCPSFFSANASVRNGMPHKADNPGDLDYYWLDPATWHSRETSPISSHPVTWQPSKEGDRLIGRVILNKRTTMPKESGALLGLKVVGGKMTDLGRLGAFITKVKKGSLADVVGHLRAGSSSFESQKMERPSISVISPTSPGALKDAPQVLPGQLSVKLWYDKVGHQLIVNVLQATDLPSRVDGRPRNPYVKMYFLPDRRMPLQILIELETALLDDEPHWYKLQTHDESSLPLPQPSPFMPRRHIHGESSSKKLQRSQRISDSDISDYEVDDGIGVVPPGTPENLKDLASKNRLGKALLLMQKASLVVEERTRQMKMKVHRFKQTTGSGSSQELDREQYSKYSIHKDQYRSCENVSAKSSDSDVSDVSAISRTSSASRLSSTSFMSEQSERPRGRISSFTPKMQGRRMGTSGRAITKSTSVSGEMYTLEHNDGSQSDTAVGTVGAGGKKRRSSLSAKVVAIVSRRSRSTSQLSQTGDPTHGTLGLAAQSWSRRDPLGPTSTAPLAGNPIHPCANARCTCSLVVMDCYGMRASRCEGMMTT